MRQSVVIAQSSHKKVSPSLTPAESNYAPIENELSAVLYGCTRFHDYIYGQKVTVETDHKPLVRIMAKPLHKLSPRIQSSVGNSYGMTSMLPGSLERKCLFRIVSAEHRQNRQRLCKSLMLLLRLITLSVISLSHQNSFKSFGTTQPTMLTYSYCKTRSCRDGLWKEAKYLKPFDHTLYFAMKSYTSFFEEISL